MAFDSNYIGRAWVVTVQIKNMQTLGLSEKEYKDPETLGNYLINHWEESGKDRTAAVAVCESGQGLYLAHLALYGNSTTLQNVAKLFGQSHVEPQLGGKKQLQDYLTKESYKEKNEQVFYTKNLDLIQDIQGVRSDIKNIEFLVNQGLTPAQIFKESFTYRKYDKMIKTACNDKRVSDMGIIKEMHNEYHFGESGTGKTHTYVKLCEENGPENVYICTDYSNNGISAFDMYNNNPCSIVVLDEYRGAFNYSTMLAILDKYTYNQVHCRYQNTYCLWTSVYICSIYPPEMVYFKMVGESNTKVDSFKQFIRRFNKIVYHYIENGEYKTFELPADQYIDASDLLMKLGKPSAVYAITPSAPQYQNGSQQPTFFETFDGKPFYPKH